MAARYKLYTFVQSAVLAAIAGVFLTHFNGGIGPSEASIMKSVRYVAIVAVAGMGSLWGTLVMSVVLNFCSLRGYFGTFDDTVFGGILILIRGLSRLRPVRARHAASLDGVDAEATHWGYDFFYQFRTSAHKRGFYGLLLLSCYSGPPVDINAQK
jgi:hypothetical protein